MAKKKAGSVRVLPKLTEAEQDLLWHMEHGYQLETDSLGSNPVLRLKDDEVIRPPSANRNTVKALEEYGLIIPGKDRDDNRMAYQGQSKEIAVRLLVAKMKACPTRRSHSLILQRSCEFLSRFLSRQGGVQCENRYGARRKTARRAYPEDTN